MNTIFLKQIELHQERLKDNNKGKQLNLENCDLSGFDLEGLNLSYAILKNTKLIDAKINKTNFRHADLSNAIFTSLNKPRIIKADFSYANLNQTILENATFTNCCFDFASMEKINAEYTKFRFSSMLQTNLDNSEASFSIFENVNLTNASMYNINLDHAEISKTNMQCVNLQNAAINQTFLRESNISSADLRNAQLPVNFLQINRFHKFKNIKYPISVTYDITNNKIYYYKWKHKNNSLRNFKKYIYQLYGPQSRTKNYTALKELKAIIEMLYKIKRE